VVASNYYIIMRVQCNLTPSSPDHWDRRFISLWCHTWAIGPSGYMCSIYGHGQCSMHR